MGLVAKQKKKIAKQFVTPLLAAAFAVSRTAEGLSPREFLESVYALMSPHDADARDALIEEFNRFMEEVD